MQDTMYVYMYVGKFGEIIELFACEINDPRLWAPSRKPWLNGAALDRVTV